MFYCNLIGRLLIDECHSYIFKNQNLIGVVLNCKRFSDLAEKCEPQGASHLYIRENLNHLHMSCFPDLVQSQAKQLKFCEQKCTLNVIFLLEK